MDENRSWLQEMTIFSAFISLFLPQFISMRFSSPSPSFCLQSRPARLRTRRLEPGWLASSSFSSRPSYPFNSSSSGCRRCAFKALTAPSAPRESSERSGKSLREGGGGRGGSRSERFAGREQLGREGGRAGGREGSASAQAGCKPLRTIMCGR